MLPHDEWLDRAKRLAIGMRIRVNHRRERRPNMVIGNDADKWWCYCQACKEGGVLQKEHVLLNSVEIPEVVRTIPSDMQPVLRSEYETTICKFLATKGMDLVYLPKLWYSVQAKRILLQDDGHWHGRDLTNKSPAKWLHYSSKNAGSVGTTTIITEDIFSMFKIEYALRDMPEYSVFSTLGAGVSSASALALKDARHLIWAYDGDKAGDSGFDQGSKRMRAFSKTQRRARPPEGLDPKDMDCQAIRDMVINNHTY